MKKRILLLLLCAMLLLTGCSVFSEQDSAEPSGTEGTEEFPRLHVEKNTLADAAGNDVQLTGMSSHGLLWYPEYTSAAAMLTLKSYGANVFRIAMYADDPDGGYLQKKEESLQLMYLAIENAISAGMYAIVDWHVLNDANPLNHQTQAIEFFQEITSHYGNCPNLLYEICNEPNGSTTWDDIYAYASAVIPVIRANAPDAVILVGTPNYSYSVQAAIAKPLEFDNIMYSFHFYAGLHSDTYGEILDDCEKNNIPVFVSEWGIAANGKWEPAISEGERFATVLNRRHISWVAWSLCNKEEIFSAILPECEKLSGWTLDDLTETGQVFFNAFQG